MPLRRVTDLGPGVRLFPDRLRDLIQDPDRVLNYAWDDVYHLGQLALIGMRLWKCGKRELNIAAELCRTHPDLGNVVHALRRAEEGILATPAEPGKE